MKKKAAYLIPVLAGILFTFYYLYLAGDNVAYSDYIRLINAYLPDVGNPDKFFVPDILTRVPVTYLGRLINVKLLDYNTMFDMVLGAVSMGAGALALASYVRRERYISYGWFLLAMVLFFGLNKWEMLTNGTGWVCFLSISGFYWHYIVLDRAVKTGHQSKRDRLILCVLPPVLTLLVAGPYCGSYSAVLTLVYLVLLVLDRKEKRRTGRLYLGYLAAVLIPLLLYLWSNSKAVYVHRGAVEGSLIGALISDPAFFVRLTLKSFASVLMGMSQLTELAEGGTVFGGYSFVYGLGLVMLGFYLWSLYLTWRYQTYKKTILPLLLILNGGLNHLLILAARWIFMKDYYGMSSRYAIQYQMGLIGILWTFSIVIKMIKEKEAAYSAAVPAACGLFAALVLAGSAYTTVKEYETAPYRKLFLAQSREAGLHYKTASDQELEDLLQHDPDEVRKAMGILEENRLNIFKE